MILVAVFDVVCCLSLCRVVVILQNESANALFNETDKHRACVCVRVHVRKN